MNFPRCSTSIPDALEARLRNYRALLAKRRLSALWQAERSGCGLRTASGGEVECLALLAEVCERLGLPCAGEDVAVDDLDDLSLALVCDCFGADDFGAAPSPRLASFRYMRDFLFGRRVNAPPSGGGFAHAPVALPGARRKVLGGDDAPSFGIGRELMGEEFTGRELAFLLQRGSTGILSDLLEDGTLFEPAYARFIADAWWSDFLSPHSFDMVDFVEREVAAGRGEAWRRALLAGFRENGARPANPVAWRWDALGFCPRDGYACRFDLPNADTAAKLARIGFDEASVDDEGIGRASCVAAHAAFRDICLRCLGLPDPSAPWALSSFSSPYLVIDLSSGKNAESYPVSGLGAEPAGGWTEEYKTSKLVLRRMEPGTFTMGSPSDEPGRLGDEALRRVTISRPFYIGVFEVTQGQWERVMGMNPSVRAGATHPVEGVSYAAARGADRGAHWPASDAVDAESFVGRLRERTGLDALDLPTEAEWEYAARAGSEGPTTDGALVSLEARLVALGRYDGNRGGETHADVGSYRPNARGLYDVQGNVFEWCLDRYDGAKKGDATDPVGPAKGYLRVLRGGAWLFAAESCRLASRIGKHVGYSDGTTGLRLACR